MQTQNHAWIKKIEKILEESTYIPQWGHVPELNFEEMSSCLAKSLQIPSLHIIPGAPQWLDAQTAAQKLKLSQATVLKLSHLPGQILWLITEEEQKLLSSHLLYHAGAKGALSSSIQKGFYKYVLLEAIDAFESLNALSDLHLQISDEAPVQENFCPYPVTIKIHQMSFLAHIALSSSLQKGLKEHFNKMPLSIGQRAMSRDLEVSLQLQIGRVSLTAGMWTKVRAGDFIVLDMCSYDPIAQKGSITFVLEDTPILHGKVKKSSIKIQDFAFYYEEEKSMTDQPHHFPDPSSSHKSSKPDGEEHLEENFFDDAMDQEHMWSDQPQPSGSMESMISKEQIPITVAVEVERLRMPLHKLLELSPGNILELSVRPEQGVSLTVGGKKVAQGELVKIGDILGLKILKIAP